MASRIAAGAAGILVAAAVLAPTAGRADQPSQTRATGRSVAASGLWTTVARYRMNERVGRVMHDASPNHLDGVIGGDVLLSGSYYHYPLAPSRTYRPEHVSYVDSSLLNPGLSSFRVSWRFRVRPQASQRYAPNFVQKGQGWPSGGMFKIMARDGRVGCLFRDSFRQAAVSTTASYQDGEWHVATCARILGSDPRVVVRVDGRLLGANHKYVGMIDNSWPLAIAGNTSCNGAQGEDPHHCNYWRGDMSWMRFQTQDPDVAAALSVPPPPRR